MRLRLILLYGVIGALVVGGFMLYGTTDMIRVMEEGGPMPENGAVIGYATQILALTVVFLGIKHVRDRVQGGIIKFLPAFGVGLAISAIASLGWVIAWEISLAWSGFDFAAYYGNYMLDAARERGAAQAELDKLAADNANFAKMYANPVFRVPITFVEMFPVGVLISLISALLLRNSRFLPARGAAA